MQISLVIIENRNLIRHNLKTSLKTNPDLEIVGEATNDATALPIIELTTPDLVLLSLSRPAPLGGLSIRQILHKSPNSKVLVLLDHLDPAYGLALLKAGASSYLLRATPLADLVQVIQMVHKGHTAVGPDLLSLLRLKLAAPPPEFNQSLSQKLTRREQEVLQLLTQGANNREIAQSLKITEKTTKNYVTKILSCLGARDRTQLVLLALKQSNQT